MNTINEDRLLLDIIDFIYRKELSLPLVSSDGPYKIEYINGDYYVEFIVKILNFTVPVYDNISLILYSDNKYRVVIIPPSDDNNGAWNKLKSLSLLNIEKLYLLLSTTVPLISENLPQELLTKTNKLL